MVDLDSICKVTVGAKQTTSMVSYTGKSTMHQNQILSNEYVNQIEDY